MIVMKFGGSSLATADRVRHVGRIVKERLCEAPILVLSAIGKTTEALIACGQKALNGEVDSSAISQSHLAILDELQLSDHELSPLLEELLNLLSGISALRELTPRTMDQLLSFGERLSVRLFAAYLNQQGVAAEAIDGWEAGLVTSSDFNRAEPLPESCERIAQTLQGPRGWLPVVTGFIGKDRHGSITTLGRGGSDLTASFIGAAIDADEVQVWKDVHGILSTDPRIFETPFPLPSISFEEAAELAYFGAKVLHPSSILPAMRKGIPVRVKNSYDPDHPGTLISLVAADQKGPVTAITHKPRQLLVHICSTRMLGQYGFLARLFQIFADLKLSVDVIATSEVSLSLTLESHPSMLEERLAEIATVKIHPGKAIVSLIGKREHSCHILERSLHTLAAAGIEVQMVSHGASQINTSLIVDDDQAQKSVRLLHNHFFERSPR